MKKINQKTLSYIVMWIIAAIVNMYVLNMANNDMPNNPLINTTWATGLWLGLLTILLFSLLDEKDKIKVREIPDNVKKDFDSLDKNAKIIFINGLKLTLARIEDARVGLLSAIEYLERKNEK